MIEKKRKKLPQWQKSEDMTKRFSGSARYLLKMLPYICSLSVDKDPTRTGITVKLPWWLKTFKKDILGKKFRTSSTIRFFISVYNIQQFAYCTSTCIT